MAIKIAYCATCVPKIVVASGDSIGSTVYDDGGVPVNCTLVADVPETQPTSYPHTTSDDTVVNDSDEWLVYLEQYIPP